MSSRERYLAPDFLRWRRLAHVKRDVMLESVEDEQWLVHLVKMATEGNGDEPSNVRAQWIVQDLVGCGLVELGDSNSTEQGWVRWPTAPEEWQPRLRAEIAKLVSGSAAWSTVALRATPKGEQWVADYYKMLEDLDPP